jgi:hypothetical protein
VTSRGPAAVVRRDELSPPVHVSPWEPPVPLTARRLLSAFPVDAMPDWMADYILAVAEFTQTPLDLPGCIALAALSAAAGGKAAVEVRRGWREPVNLYVVVALPPGSRKSAVFAAMTAPLFVAERRLTEVARKRVAEAKLTRRIAARAAELSASAAEEGGRPEALAGAITDAMTAEAITVPVLPRLVADDITPEAAASLLAEQGGRLAVLSAEGGIFATLAGRYSSGAPNLEVFLKGHAGDLLRVDRKGRPSEHVEAPALTLGLAIQPELLADLDAMPGFRGRGLLARMLYALPKNTVGARRIGPDPVPDDIALRYETELYARVLRLADRTDRAVLRLTPEAHDLVLGLEARIEPRLGPGGDLEHVADWASKLIGAVVRIAGLIRLAGRGVDDAALIDGATVEAAARLGHYFLGHALAAFDHMGADPVTDDARAVLAWIERTCATRFTRRDLFTAVRSGRFRKVADLDPALELLESHGHVRRESTPDAGPRGGRPPSPSYLVNPAVVPAERAQRAEPHT